jgi:predicted ATPase
MPGRLFATRPALHDSREAAGESGMWHASVNQIFCGNYVKAGAILDELVALADEKGASLWKAWGMLNRGCTFRLTGKATEAVQTIPSALTAFRATGATLYVPMYLSNLAMAHAELDHFEDVWRCISEAIAAVKSSKDKWCEADINRIAGEIALMSPELDAARAEACFERALAVARNQQAKSWELRSAMSMARLWRDQGKRDKARDLLAPVYGWFTEGFNTLDLKQAKVLLDELA